MAATTRAHTLKDYLRANSYARVPDETRQEEGWGTYKKGYEVRIVVRTQTELKELRRLLQDAGFKPGKAYRKSARQSAQWVQPVYGKQPVNQLQALKTKKR